MEKINVKEKNEVKIGPFKLLLRIIWSPDDDVKAEWQNEPNRKTLEKALENVDSMEPTVEPTSTSKKGKTRKINELVKNDFAVEKGPKIKDNKTDYKKDKINEEREHE